MKARKKETIFNENKKNKDNSFISSNINQSKKTCKIIEQNNPLKKENKNILSYPSTTKEKKKNNYKKIDAYNYIKGRQENKNRLENQKK